MLFIPDSLLRISKAYYIQRLTICGIPNIKIQTCQTVKNFEQNTKV
jgi:hypothetical protein